MTFDSYGKLRKSCSCNNLSHPYREPIGGSIERGRGAANRSHLRLHGDAPQPAGRRAGHPRLPPVRPALQPQLLGPHPLRRRARARARVRRRARGGGGTGARTGVPRLPDLPPVQRARRAWCSCRSASSTNGTSRRSFTASSGRSSTRSSSRRRGSRSAPACTASSATGSRYRGYVLAPLNALEFSADEGLRGGRQKGAEANVRNVAFTGRLEYLGVRGLQLGVSGWRGDSSFAVPRLDTTVWLVEADARYRAGRAELRGQYAHVGIGDAARLNEAIERTTGVSPNIARQLRGFYLEGAYTVWNGGPARDLALFARYENFDTQFRMPDGFTPLEEFDRTAWIGRRDLLPRPGRRREGRLHHAQEPERLRAPAADVQRRHRLVVLRMHRCLCQQSRALVLGLAIVSPSRASTQAPPVRKVSVEAERFSFSPSRIKVDRRGRSRDPPAQRRHVARLQDRGHRHQRRDPEARARARSSSGSRRRPPAGCSSSAPACAAPATTSCAARSSSRRRSDR